MSVKHWSKLLCCGSGHEQLIGNCDFEVSQCCGGCLCFKERYTGQTNVECKPESVINMVGNMGGKAGGVYLNFAFGFIYGILEDCSGLEHKVFWQPA